MKGALKRGLAMVASIAAIALVGCSGEDESAPREISGAPKQVANVVERLEQAIRAGDYEAICTRLFTAAARERAGGDRCAASLRDDAGDLRRPRLRLVAISIDGERAQARVRTTASGQGTVEETIELERRNQRYRIAGLENVEG